MKVEFFRHAIGEEEIASISETLRGVFLTTGEKVSAFENQLASYLTLPHAVALSSCSAGMQLMLRCLGIGAGDEVITTPLTFVATANAVEWAGARPVFVDVEPGTGLINPKKIEAAITNATRAIIPVHLYGQMADMPALRAIADEHGLKIIEDAAHCIEGMREDVRPGALSDAACFSFYATKSITSGEGGAIALKNSDLVPILRQLRNHGMTQDASRRYGQVYSHWDMEMLGGKFNMNNIQAALLIPQLEKIDQLAQARRARGEYYRRKLANVRAVELLKIHAGSSTGEHLFPIFVQESDRDRILFGLRENEIGCTVNYNPVHLTTYYRNKYGYKPGDFPVAEKMGHGTISLPLHTLLKSEEQDYVCDVLSSLTAKSMSAL